MAIDVESIIIDTLLTLVEEDGVPLERVTVKRILERSGVSRQIFYNHFLDKNDLVCQAYEQRMVAAFNGTQEGFGYRDELVEALRLMHSHGEFLRQACKMGGQNCLSEHMLERATRFDLEWHQRLWGDDPMPEELRLATVYHVTASVQMTLSWILTGSPCPRRSWPTLLCAGTNSAWGHSSQRQRQFPYPLAADRRFSPFVNMWTVGSLRELSSAPLASILNAETQSKEVIMSVDVRRSAQGQAMPRETVALPAEAFGPSDKTTVYWLGNAGFLLNSRGTTIMCDPLLVGFDMPVLVEPPILPEDVPAFDALLYTHIDNDHFARETLAGIKEQASEVHATHYVAQVARDEERVTGATGHAIGERFCIGSVDVTLTPTWHNWQDHMTSEKYQHRRWAREEYCGYWFDTPDGSIWLPSDSRPLPEFLEWEKTPDMMLFDFADNGWHIGFAGAVELANRYPESELLLIHWGCVDAPEYTPFNGDPERLQAAVKNPERVHALALGEGLAL